MEKIISRKCLDCGKTKQVGEFVHGERLAYGARWISTVCRDCDWLDQLRLIVGPLLKVSAPAIFRPRPRIKLPKIKILRKKKEKPQRQTRQPKSPRILKEPKEPGIKKTPEQRRVERKERYAKLFREHPERASRAREVRKVRAIEAGGNKVGWREWSKILKKYGAKCLCCGATGVKLTQDHVLPISKGGKTVPENMQPLCLSCNIRKYNKYIDYRPF